MYNDKSDSSNAPIAEEVKFLTNCDFILEMAKKCKGPVRIVPKDGNSLIMIGWNDFWETFGILYPDGEREKIEEECRKLIKSQDL